MARYIDADLLIGKIDEVAFEIDAYSLIIDAVEQAPTADVREVRRGKWLNFVGDFSVAECDKCGEIYEVSPDEKPREEFFKAFMEFYRFCPSCGADVREVE